MQYKCISDRPSKYIKIAAVTAGLGFTIIALPWVVFSRVNQWMFQRSMRKQVLYVTTDPLKHQN